MDATPTRFGFGPDDVTGAATAERMNRKWSVLHDAAATVGGIAGAAARPLTPEERRFPEIICKAGGWRRELAEQGIEDLSAILEPGLSALLTACGRGASCVAPAQALWREFIAARDALLRLAPPRDD